MKKHEVLSYVGNMQQVASIQPVLYTEGIAKGLGAYQIKNGDLSFTVMQDKCLDISHLSYKGINLSFLSKPGLQYKAQKTSQAGVSTIMGGFLFTAGFDNIGAPATIDGKEYDLHGNLRSIPAEHLCANATWLNDEYILSVSGEIRESELFGKNLLLRREIRTTFPGKSFIIKDEIENQSFHDEAFLILYHMNFGYPFLSEHCNLLIPSEHVVPRDAISKKHLDRWNHMDKPIPNEQEYVFIHTPSARKDGKSIVGVYNTELKIGVSIEYEPDKLPYFMEWKSLGSGDYALGFEPANGNVLGRQYHHDNKSLPMIHSFETRTFELKITILDGDADYEDLQTQLKECSS